MGQNKSQHNKDPQLAITDEQDETEQQSQEEPQASSKLEQEIESIIKEEEKAASQTQSKSVTWIYFSSFLFVAVFFACTLVLSRMYYQSTIIFFANAFCMIVVLVQLVLLVANCKSHNLYSSRTDHFITVLIAVPVLSLISTIVLVTLISEQAGLTFLHMFTEILPAFEQFGVITMVVCLFLFCLCALYSQFVHHSDSKANETSSRKSAASKIMTLIKNNSNHQNQQEPAESGDISMYVVREQHHQQELAPHPIQYSNYPFVTDNRQ